MRLHARYRNVGVEVWHADCLKVLATLADASVDAVITDPPYSLGFMSKAWDTHAGPVVYQEWCRTWAAECLRVLKPGGHLLAFGGSRTHHRLMAGIEDAGFELRDCISHMFGSGFPKGRSVSADIDRMAGATRTEGAREWTGGQRQSGVMGVNLGTQTLMKYDAPATDDAKKWQGWNVALKPAAEFVVCARAPLSEKTVAANVLAHGTGAINVDACRVTAPDKTPVPGAGYSRKDSNSTYELAGDPKFKTTGIDSAPGRRWPANVVLSHAATEDGGDACAQGCIDGCAVRELDKQGGVTTSTSHVRGIGAKPGMFAGLAGASGVKCVDHRNDEPEGYADSGGASRFFPAFRYQAKAPARERPKVDGVAHPTCKPLALMKFLVRLVTPPGGLVLDPFAGSGTTVEACITEGFRCIAVESSAEYLPLIDVRVARAVPPTTPEPEAVA